MYPNTFLDAGLDEPDRVRVHAQVIRPDGLVLAVDGQHLLNTNFTQRKCLEACRSLKTEDAVLTDPLPAWCIGTATCRAVIDEERVESSPIDLKVSRVDSAKAPCTLTGGEDRVVVGRLSCIGRV